MLFESELRFMDPTSLHIASRDSGFVRILATLSFEEIY